MQNLRVLPGNPVGEFCPGCGGPSFVARFEQVAGPVGHPPGPAGVKLGGPARMNITRGCNPCLLEWNNVVGCAIGSGEILREVRELSAWTANTRIEPRLVAEAIAWYQGTAGINHLIKLGPARDLVEQVPLPAESTPTPPAILGRVIGYRAWRIDDTTLELVGTVRRESWIPGVNRAVCTKAAHLAPNENCQCGLYALARFNDKSIWWLPGHILGAVEMWSDVDEERNEDRFFLHPEPGMRSQYARIVLLSVDEGLPKLKKDLVRRVLAPYYGADVCKKSHLEDAAKEHGRLVPDELIQWCSDAQVQPQSTANRNLAQRLPQEAKGDAVRYGDEFAIPHPDGFLVPHSFTKKGSEERQAQRVREDHQIEATAKRVAMMLEATQKMGTTAKEAGSHLKALQEALNKLNGLPPRSR